jgi:hypothetical protein
MLGPLRIGGYTEVYFNDPDEIIGASIQAFHCEKCGYVELYREEKAARREAEAREEERRRYEEEEERRLN